MKLLLLLFLTVSIYANSLLTEYRNNGFDSIEKKMDLELTKKEYWSEFLKDKKTTFGYLESYSEVLTCDKERSTLNLYTKDKNSTYKFEQNYSAFTGKEKGDKTKEGDLKTPIGIYTLTEKISNPDSFYGPLAFVTSYPNIYDRYRGKNGSGIWIRGLPTEQERDEFTKGCIAINNQNIEYLDKKIDIKKTLLIINSAPVHKDVPKDVVTSILSQLYLWRYSWIYNDIDKYLGFYSDDFVRTDGMKFNDFKTYKKRVFNKLEKKTIIFNDINLVPYPNTENIYQLTFKEIYSSESFQFTGEKTLMLKLGEKNQIKIFTEK
ncbi:MAG: L,D-transpeptidase family protein [Epsilonproteobacteria bacterium]|nr:L,D-transpeptidase family protein [Campylobacterota bacterium]PIP10866.1 MAG: hypothetical protein COX50_03325 [Sulfurimonas sp. CG23_combo_of_CG06-09_8_20_14_all_36_33]PIS26725.1 MAG: hypothetical protein COT46_01295 [Sulfurimonas sp. CG08_land_8_20_14_0_20_36_33]PIU35043.1 MAG: hypothetical protein COT05_04840 [Sulfurimonas sp. CG07_land_8_20_14_0_80_36_56]PIV03288.1 MAG: hypothetical protein COS56_08785 [Sulfurimonas sp. CG03_land_8_20_14_0_80_36_25]PIV36511.1 MAG: hypothetical protein C